MSIKETGEHKFVFVKKANMYCETWFEIDRNGKAIQKQNWLSKEQYANLSDEAKSKKEERNVQGH